MSGTLTPSDIYTLLRPVPCNRRVYLRHHADSEPEAGPFEDLLRKLGDRHEAAHLAELRAEGTVEVVGGDEDPFARTEQLVAEGADVIYQPSLRAGLDAAGTTWTVIGRPDLLIREADGYVIRDAKLTRRVTKKDHPEVLHAVQVYGWLYEQSFGAPPRAVEILGGDGELHRLDYDPAEAIDALATVAEFKTGDDPVHESVGLSKCQDCDFRSICWDPAVAELRVDSIANVDQGLASQLRSQGIESASALLDRFSVEELAELKRPWGKKTQRVGSKAGSILDHAAALVDGAPRWLGANDVPTAANLVMFDLEGLPPFADDLDQIYLWGFQVFGEDPGEFLGVAALLGDDGDQDTWFAFLDGASTVFSEYGDLPWVHWADHEKTNVNKYIERYGDPNGVGQRVLDNLHDLRRTTQQAVALPVPGYGLKMVEQYIGFERTQDEIGGAWSIAKYIEAVETDDPTARAEVLAEVETYNREDLAATWAVVEWLRREGPAA